MDAGLTKRETMEKPKKKKPFGVLRSDINYPAEEEGLRSSSFLEIPGAHEIKGNIKKYLETAEFPGAKFAASAADVVLPEDFSEVIPMGKGIGAGIRSMAGSKAPAVSKGAARAKAAIEDIKDLPMPAPKEAPALDYGKILADDRKSKIKPSGFEYRKGEWGGDADMVIDDAAAIAERRQEALDRMARKKAAKEKTYIVNRKR